MTAGQLIGATLDETTASNYRAAKEMRRSIIMLHYECERPDVRPMRPALQPSST
jgi:hypothetical protein